MATSKNNLVAGFDPGGKNSFGWCVAEVLPKRTIRVVTTKQSVGAGLASNADEAFGKAHKVIKDSGGTLLAAGIDAPLTWARNGGQREADKRISKRFKSSAQAVNSLWGACLVQGFLLAKTLEEKYPDCLITETNPKPLWEYLKQTLGIKTARKLCDTSWEKGEPDHIHDAIVSAWAAAAAKAQTGGCDLYSLKDEVEVHRILDNAVYWWPK